MKNNQEAFRNYLNLEKKYAPLTVIAYTKDLNFFQNFLAIEFEHENLLEVNYNQIRSWIIALVDSGVSNVSVNRKIASLKAFYIFLLKTKQIQISPLIKHKALKTSKQIQIPFSEIELSLVLNKSAYPDGFEGLRDKLIIDLFYTTGIRRAELIALKITNVDISNNTIKVLGKRNKERILPILPIIATQIVSYLSERVNLEAIKNSDTFFVTTKGVKLNISLVYRLINSYFSTVSVKVKKSPHVLRHSFATHLLNNGADINSVKELLGHASLASTQIYTSSSLSELKKVYGTAHPRSLK